MPRLDNSPTILQKLLNDESSETGYTKTQLNILRFFRALSFKRLVPALIGQSTLYKSVFELFAAILYADVSKADIVKGELMKFIRATDKWSDVREELSFLDVHKNLISNLLQNIESPVYSGFLLTLLSAKEQKRLKIYQFHEGRSLITCEIGALQEGMENLPVAVLISSEGFKFCLLKKTKDVESDFPINFFDDIKAGDSLFEIKLNEREVASLALLTEHQGFYPQLFVDYNDLMTEKEYLTKCKSELSDTFDRIIRMIGQGVETGTTGGSKMLSVENLGIENLNPKLKADILFGHKTTDCESKLRYKEKGYISYPTPIGLLNNYALKKPPIETQQDKSRAEPENQPPMLSINLDEREPEAKVTDENQPSSISVDSKQFPKNPVSPTGSKKPIIVNQNRNIRYLGRLKFIDEKNKFGFIVKEIDNSDIFFHLSDMEASGIPIKLLQENKGYRFSFAELEYIGKHSFSKKAVDIKLFNE